MDDGNSEELPNNENALNTPNCTVKLVKIVCFILCNFITVKDKLKINKNNDELLIY